MAQKSTPTIPPQVSEMSSNLEVLRRRYTGVVLGTPFDTKNLPNEIKRKISSSSNGDDKNLWGKIEDMEERCRVHEAKWEARQRLERGPNETQQD